MKEAVIQLHPVDPSRVQASEFGTKVTIPKRFGALIAFRPEEKRVLRLADLPPIPDEERGKRYDEEEVGWVFESTTEEYVQMTRLERSWLVHLLLTVPTDLPEDQLNDLVKRINYPSITRTK